MLKQIFLKANPGWNTGGLRNRLLAASRCDIPCKMRQYHRFRMITIITLHLTDKIQLFISIPLIQRNEEILLKITGANFTGLNITRNIPLFLVSLSQIGRLEP